LRMERGNPPTVKNEESHEKKTPLTLVGNPSWVKKKVAEKDGGQAAKIWGQKGPACLEGELFLQGGKRSRGGKKKKSTPFLYLN